MNIHVLNSRSVGAWAWRDGSVIVSAGLVRMMSDDELAAVVAHELGHLRAGGVAMVSAFDGCGAGGKAETRADAEAWRLLVDRHVPVGSLAEALVKVRDLPGTSYEVRVHLNDRIRLLQAPGDR